jgi:hypothetical protein
MWTVMSSGPWWMAQLLAFLVYMPTTAFFLWLAFRIVDGRDTVMDRRMVKLVLGVTGLCPLALQIMGWDIYRWYALAGFTSFLTLTIVCSQSRPSELERVGDSKAVQNAAILLIGVNLATGTGLFDGYHVDTFPFVDHWRALLQWMLSGGNWPQPAS